MSIEEAEAWAKEEEETSLLFHRWAAEVWLEAKAMLLIMCQYRPSWVLLCLRFVPISLPLQLFLLLFRPLLAPVLALQLMLVLQLHALLLALQVQELQEEDLLQVLVRQGM